MGHTTDHPTPEVTPILGRSKQIKFVLAAVAALLLAVFGATASASASSSTAPRPFAAQALASGLTSAQAAALQGQVNQILTQDGGTQVAANEIALPHGASVLLVLPGQKYAHLLPGAVNLGFSPTGTATTVRPEASGSFTPQVGYEWGWPPNWCPYLYFCAWQGENGAGTQFNVSTCNENQPLPGSGWSGVGSWINNQTAGTVAYLLNSSSGVYYATPGSGSWNNAYDWNPIWYLDACKH
jgi:hypothetical protein